MEQKLKKRLKRVILLNNRKNLLKERNAVIISFICLILKPLCQRGGRQRFLHQLGTYISFPRAGIYKLVTVNTHEKLLQYYFHSNNSKRYFPLPVTSSVFR